MQTILTPNIEFIMQRLKKGNDRIPLNGESFGRNLIGPERKNLLIPNDAANRLKRKVIRGKAALKVSNFGTGKPNSFLGKTPSVTNKIARDVFTCNDIRCIEYRLNFILKGF